MSFAVSLYTFAKKVNSTAIPSTADGTYNCRIKDTCSILNPTIIFSDLTSSK